MIKMIFIPTWKSLIKLISYIIPYKNLASPLISVCLKTSHTYDTGPGSSVVECPLQGTGGHGFDHGPRHTKVVKMVQSKPRLALRHVVELGLVDPVSG